MFKWCKFCQKSYLRLILIIVGVLSCWAECSSKPHIVVILADDLGWNDVSFHGSNQIPTPNIDALAYNGIILNQHYVQALCTPSRAAFLTGKYPIHTGMQHDVILENAPWGLSLNETLMPEYLRKAGYSTHAIGKWHLGYFQKEYTPTYRGFDTHFGYWNGLQDYYNHLVYTTAMSGNFSKIKGYDMRRNMEVDTASNGSYSTDVFTKEAVKIIQQHNVEKPMFMYFSHLAPHTGNQINPLQAPDEEVAKFGFIEDPERRIYAAMVSIMDKSVGEVIAALRAKQMLENSIIIFLADNGGQTWGIHANHASNYPLRGMKFSPWEGGVRGVGAIWSPLLKRKQRVSNQVIHMTDWLPTLMRAAKINVSLEDIDGINMWDTLSENHGEPRTEFVVNIDDLDNYASLRVGKWKYVNGSPDVTQDEWYGENGRDLPYENYAKDVELSRAGVSFTGIVTKLQIHSKKAGTSLTETVLSTSTLLKLRSSATVTCTIEDVTPEYHCNPMEAACLFDISTDPCERKNVASVNKDILAQIETKLAKYRSEVIPARNKPTDPNADPIHWNGVWANWQDPPSKYHKPQYTTIITLAVMVLLFVIVIVVLLVISVKSSSVSMRQNMQVDRIFKNFDSKSKPGALFSEIESRASNSNIRTID